MEPISSLKFYGQEENCLSTIRPWGQHSRILSTFSRQYDAFRAYDAIPDADKFRCKIFSYETASCGKRQFLLVDLATFYNEFHGVNSEQRHVYEIIRDTFPCRLYFDLEFNIPSNANCNGDQLVMLWIQTVMWKLYQTYELAIGIEQVIVLDSTTPDKFSKHIHIILPNESTSPSSSREEHLFANNLEVGRFIQSILADITNPVAECALTDCVTVLDGSYRIAKPEFACLWVNTNERKGFIVDLGVYTRNRAFRLFNSCKFGKTTRLAIAPNDRQRFPMLREVTKRGMPIAIRDVLSWTFVIPADILRAECPVDTMRSNDAIEPSPKRSRKSETSTEDGDEDLLSFQALLPYFNSARYAILPPLLSAVSAANFCIHSLSRTAAAMHRDNASLSLQSAAMVLQRKDRELARSKYPREASPFPQLDCFVLSHLAGRGGLQGYIQSWHLFYRRQGSSFPYYLLRYQIAGNRFCECVGRMHKSNGIYFDVNLMAKEISQGCWDVDCKGFRFSVLHIPHEIFSMTASEVEDWAKQAYGLGSS